MKVLTIRDLDSVVHAKLRQRAAGHGRSIEAEARFILTAAVEKGGPVHLVGSIREHFAGTGVEFEPPDRKSAGQRPVPFDA